jgi:hypothetical protein
MPRFDARRHSPNASSRVVYAPAVHEWLRLGLVPPVVEPVPLGNVSAAGNVNQRVPAEIRSACIEHQDPVGRIGTEPVGERTAGRAAADEVVPRSGQASLRPGSTEGAEGRGDDTMSRVATHRRGFRGPDVDLVAAAPSLWRARVVIVEGRAAVSAARIVSVALIVVGVIATALAAGQLAGGWTEIPHHWWSNAAAVPLGAGVVPAVVAWRRHPGRRTEE